MSEFDNEVGGDGKPAKPANRGNIADEGGQPLVDSLDAALPIVKSREVLRRLGDYCSEQGMG